MLNTKWSLLQGTQKRRGDRRERERIGTERSFILSLPPCAVSPSLPLLFCSQTLALSCSVSMWALVADASGGDTPQVQDWERGAEEQQDSERV